MSGLSRSLLIVAAIAALSLAAASPGIGANTRRHLDCYAVTIGVSGPLGGGVIPTNALLTNNWSFAIPAGTEFTVNYGGHQSHYVSPGALPPGGHLSFQIATTNTSGACDAYYLEASAPKGGNFGKLLNLPNLTLQTSP